MPTTVEALLHKLLEAQGEIHPGMNDEFLEAWWVRQVVEDALRQLRTEMQEIEVLLEEAGHPLCNTNGNLRINALKGLVDEVYFLRAAQAKDEEM